MRYKKTQLALPKKGQPLDTRDMLYKLVNQEDQFITIELPPPSKGLVCTIKPSVGLLIFFKNFVYQFNP